MKLITKLISALVFLVSFVAALYLGYRLFTRSSDTEDYFFGDSLYDEGDDQDLYQSGEEPVAETEEVLVEEELDQAKAVNSMLH